MQRAEAVAGYLESRGVPGAWIETLAGPDAGEFGAVELPQRRAVIAVAAVPVTEGDQ